MEMNPETIHALLDAFERSDWQEMTVTIGSDRIHVSRDGTVTAPPPPAAPAPAPAAPPTASAAAPAPVAAVVAASPTPNGAPSGSAPAPVDAVGTVITAPSVGLFWRAPSPSSPPFVEVGGRVAAGDTIGIVEVMKLMSQVASPVAGVVTAVHVENGEMVEFGEALVVVDPAA